jgi:hypothetical protein
MTLSQQTQTHTTPFDMMRLLRREFFFSFWIWDFGKHEQLHLQLWMDWCMHPVERRGVRWHRIEIQCGNRGLRFGGLVKR